ncbi:MAG: hypothetical protein M3174_02505, partial [Actinomycetota bacterium]|nr:hypothetical protein [Actinomycetota bacterium]
MYAAACGAALLFLRRVGAAVYAATLAVSLLGGQTVARIEQRHDAPVANLAAGVPSCALQATVAEHAGELGTLLRVERLSCEGAVLASGEVIAEQLEHDAGTRLVAKGWLLPLTHDGFDVARRRTGAGAVFHLADVEVARSPVGALAIAAAFRRSLTSSTKTLEPRQA